MIFDILPVQPGCEQFPAIRVLPLAIAIFFPLMMGPYVLHFIQYPSTPDMILKAGDWEEILNPFHDFR